MIRHIRHVCALALGIAIAAQGATPVALAGPRTAGSSTASVSESCVDGWLKMDLPESAKNGYGRDVLTLGGRPDWVLGMTGPKRIPWRPIALRWRGGEWRDVPVPWAGVIGGFMGGDSTSRSHAWAVGTIRPGSYVPISARWNGSGWSAVRVPDPPGANAALVDAAVTSGRRAWAVGTYLHNGRVQPLAMVWRPSTGWRLSEIGTGPGEAALTSVETRPDGAIWATGWRTVGGVPRPLLAIRSAGAWVLQDTASLPGGTAMLTDLAFRSDSEAFASGFLMPSTGGTLPLLERWNGASWSVVDLPWAGGFGGILRSVAVAADGALTLAGTRLATDQRRSRGFAARRVAGTWTVTEFEQEPEILSEMNSAAVTTNGALAVGHRVNATRVRITCGDGAGTAAQPKDGAAKDGHVGHAAEGDHPDRALELALDRDLTDVATAEMPPRGTLGTIRVREVADDVGLGLVSSTWGGVTADFDKDGWRDVLINRHNVAPAKLMLGGPTGFRRFGGLPVKLRDRHGCTVGDVENDGYPDIYCAHGGNRGLQVKASDLFARPGTHEAAQRAAAFQVLDPFGRGREATFLRLDDDPYPELYVTNEPERVDGLPATNRLYLNEGGVRYRSAPEQGLDASMGGTCATSGDVDDDGDDDLLVCTVERWHGIPPSLRAFRNDGGILTDATTAWGLSSGFAYDAITADLDGDGDIEVVQVGPGRLVISRFQGGRLNVVREIGVLSPVAVVAGDATGDGALDLFVVRGGTPNRNDLLLINGGNGTSFSSVVMPSRSGGIADDALRIDHDKNGLDDFVVMNGFFSRGPVQLFAFYP